MTDNTLLSLHEFEHNEQMEMLSRYEENVGQLRDNIDTENKLEGHNFPNTLRQKLEIQLAAGKNIWQFNGNNNFIFCQIWGNFLLHFFLRIYL